VLIGTSTYRCAELPDLPAVRNNLTAPVRRGARRPTRRPGRGAGDLGGGKRGPQDPDVGVYTVATAVIAD
jgi:hypothetical protein